MSRPNIKHTLASGSVLAILAAVFALEGGYVDDKNDPGGATNHGVTVAVAKQAGYTGPMQLLPKELASEIYLQNYIVKPGYMPMVELSPAVAEELVDSAVNAGPGRSSVWFQESLNAVNRGGKDYASIPVDGKVGPATIQAYRGLVAVRGKVPACEIMLKLLDARQAAHYVSLTKLNMFTPGWVMKRIGNVPIQKCTTYDSAP